MGFWKLIKETKIQVALIVLLTLIVFANSLFNNFVWDDHLFLETWPDIQTFNIKGIFGGSAPQEQGNVYRPVRGVLWALSFRLFGTNPFWYHLQALLIHLGATVLVYLITTQLVGSRLWVAGSSKEKSTNYQLQAKRSERTTNYLPFIVALIFGLHPIHTETINYVSTSMETWGSLMMFASFAFYLYMRIQAIEKHLDTNTVLLLRVGSVVLATLAFFTYEMTLTLPLILVLAEIYANKVRITKRMYANVSPYFAAAGIFIFIRVAMMGIFSRTDYLGYSFYHTMLVMVKVIVRYIMLLFVPYNQTAIHNLVGDFPSSMIPYDKLDPILSQTIFDLPVLAAILVIGLLGVWAFRYREQFPLASFGVLWFFITLLPVSYIIPHGGAMAEKYLYIPSFGLILAAIFLLFEFYANVKRINPNNKIVGQVLIYLGVALMVFYGVSTVVRNRVWKNDITLFSDVVAKSPNNLLANYTLGIWLGKIGDLESAKQYYLHSIDLAYEFWEARFNLANVFVRLGDFEKAAEQYKLITEINPNNRAASNILSNLDLIKESSPSAQGEQLFASYKAYDGVSFMFPAAWTVADAYSVVGEANKASEPPEREGTVLTDAQGVFKVRIKAETLTGLSNKDEKIRDEAIKKYLNSEPETGTIVQEGLAQVPNFKLAWVKVWERDDVGADGSKGVLKLMQFFLFGENKAVKVLVYPTDSLQMGLFDAVLGSIKLDEK